MDLREMRQSYIDDGYEPLDAVSQRYAKIYS